LSRDDGLLPAPSLSRRSRVRSTPLRDTGPTSSASHRPWVTAVCYTTRSLPGEWHADTRGRLETFVRVHAVGKLAEAHAGGGGVRAGLRAEVRRGRRELGPVGAAA